MTPDILKKLQGFSLSARLTGDARSISDSALETDGRKTAKLMRTLVEEGYLQDCDDCGQYPLTMKAYNEITPEKPDLGPRTFAPVDRYKGTGTKVHANDIVKCLGVQWSELSYGEQKYIIQHAKDYKVFSWNSSNQPDQAKPHIIGDQESFKTRQFGYYEYLYITDAAMEAELKQRLYDNKFAYLKNHNLAWGLTKLGLLNEADKDHVHQSHGDAIWGDHFRHFGIDPEKWPEDLRDVLAALRKRVMEDFARINALEGLKARIEMEPGGWAGIMERYEALVTEAMAATEDLKKVADAVEAAVKP